MSNIQDTINDLALGLYHAEIIDKKTKPGFKWFFEQEIYEQPEAVSKALNYGARIAGNNKVKLGGLDSREDDLKSIDNLIIAA